MAREILRLLGVVGIAAVICVAICLWKSKESIPIPPDGGKVRVTRLSQDQIESLPPTEWAYFAAARSSPADLDLFVNHQADTLLTEPGSNQRH